jgi:catechol 2,3-dioxygenase-like lactoylglutathione lyase family enzyme
MHLNHLNLPVADLAAARVLFEELFGFQCLDQRGDALASLTDGAGFSLVLANAARFGDEIPRYPKVFHVGFILDQREQVDQMYDRVVAAGITPAHRPRHQHGSYGFYFTALDGILFEIASYEGDG